MKKLLFYCFVLCIASCRKDINKPAGAVNESVITYNDTYSGGGNESLGYTTPQFNPSLGTLDSIVVTLTSSVYYNLTLTNPTAAANDYYSTITREDLLTDNLSSAQYGVLFDDVFTINCGPFQVSADSSYTLDNKVLMSNVVEKGVIVNSLDIAAAQGTGTITYTFLPATNITFTNGVYTDTVSYSDSLSVTTKFYYKK